jgi:hypothetical protein
MLKSKFENRYLILSIGILLCLVFSVVGSFAQAPTAPVPGQTPTPLGPKEEEVSTTYREPKKDPFFDEKLLKKKEENKPKTVKAVEAVPPPSFEERDAIWKQRREEARRSGRPEPAPSEKYLIEEMSVLGIYKKPDGQGVFLKPKTASTTMIFATVGQKFWNGSIRRIEGNQIEVEVLTKLSNNTTRSDSQTLRFTRGK